MILKYSIISVFTLRSYLLLSKCGIHMQYHHALNAFSPSAFPVVNTNMRRNKGREGETERERPIVAAAGKARFVGR